MNAHTAPAGATDISDRRRRYDGIPSHASGTVAPLARRVAPHRVLTLITAMSLFGVSFATWATVVEVPMTGALAVVGFGAGLLLTIAAATLPVKRLHRVDIALLVLGILLLFGWALSNIYRQPGYGTDEAAFEQYSASLLLHGRDPYGVNLVAALTTFRVPIQYATYLMGGGVAHTLGYPPLSVLVTALFIPITHGVQSVIIADVVALAATCVLAFLLLPREWKALSILTTIGLPILFGYSVSGVNAILMGAFLVVAAWKWTGTGEAGRLTLADKIRLVCFGLAIATQQLAWFMVPFFLVGVWRLRRSHLSRRNTMTVLTAAILWIALPVVVTNLPFVLWHPERWLAGVTSPLTQHAIPYGQGLIDMALFFHTGGGALQFYTMCGLLALLALLAIYIIWFNRFGVACFILPVVALFFTTRSLAEYFMALVAVWMMSIVTVDSSVFDHIAPLWSSRHMGLKIGAMLAPAISAGVLALCWPSPVRLSILSVRTNGQFQRVWQVKVRATNRSSVPVVPHFSANYVGQATTFFYRRSGPQVLPPGRAAVYTLVAPNRGSMPGVALPFTILATTDKPETISSSARYVPQTVSTDIQPGYVDHVLQSGQAMTFRVVLRSPFGALVHKRGVRIALGQVIYGQESLIPAEASINGGAEGQTPIIAYTNTRGVATFRVTDQHPQGEPVYLQAWVAGKYPSGYSSIVPVLWRR